jgi:NAD(P)H dehydrogenase (quinone)
MRVLTVYAHPNPASFCHALLDRFTHGLTEAGHTSEVVDLYAIKFDPSVGSRSAPHTGCSSRSSGNPSLR